MIYKEMDIKSFESKVVFITGSEKNAGKTTFMNFILNRVRKKTAPCFLTIGIDGEKEDLIFGTPKPKVYAAEGDFFVTSEKMLENFSGVYETFFLFPVKTVLGRLALVKAIRGGFIELVGPEDNRQLKEITKTIKEVTDCGTIFIDGAANRVTQVATDKDASFVFVIKVSPRNQATALDRIKSFSITQNFERWEETEQIEANTFFVNGALTSRKLKAIPKDTDTVIVSDFTKLFLTYNELKKLTEEKRVMFMEHFELIFIVVNLYDLCKDEFRENIKDCGLDDKILFNPYEHTERGQ